VKITKKINCFFNSNNSLVVLLVSVFFIMMLFVFSGCKKEENVPPPSVEIISPAENELIYLPGEMHLHLKLKSRESIKFIQVSIENYAQVPIFQPKEYFPDEETVEINEYLNITLVPEGQHPPYYLHLRVIDVSGTNNYYREIQLTNPDLKYLGFYLTTRPSVNLTDVYFYTEDLNESHFISVEGDFRGTLVSDYQDIFYLNTVNPSKIRAFQHTDQELLWEAIPELPFPEFTDLHFNANYLFAGTANGRILSFHSITGSQGVLAKRMSDSIPTSIATSNGYIIGNYEAKNANNNSLVVFYRSTGILFQKRPMNYHVVDIYFEKYGFGFLVFGNGNLNGTQILYQPVNNSITETVDIEEGLIHFTEQYNQDKFFLNTGNKIVFFDSVDESTKQLLTLDEPLIDMAFERISSQLFLVYTDRVEIFSYPSMQKVATQAAPHSIKSIELRVAY